MSGLRHVCMAEAGEGSGGGATVVAEPLGSEAPGSDSAPVAPVAPAIPEAVPTSRARTEKGTFAKPEDLGPIDWRASLPAEFQKDGTVQSHKSLTDFVKSALETKAMVGRSLQLPKDETDTEGWATVYKKLGCPEDAKSYTVTPPPLPEGVSWDAEMERQFREEAHAAGLSQKQADAMVAFEGRRWHYLANQVQAQQAEEDGAAKAALQGEFGASYPRLEQAAMHVLEQWGQGVWGGEAGTKAVAKLKDLGAFKDADIIKSLANLFESMREGDHLTNDTYPAGMTTPGDLDAQTALLMKKKMSPEGATPAEQKQIDELYALKARLAQGR